MIKKWRIERFQDEEVRQKYQEALSVEVEGFQARVHAWKAQGLRGSELVKTVVEDWEDTVKRVASKEIGEKVIVCGKAARWWDDEIKEKIRLRRQVYKEISSGSENKWGEYYKLRTEIKELVRKKKLDSWNEVIEKANKDFYENRKEFWAFVGRTSKASRKGIASLRSASGSCVTSTKGKLEVLREHYERLGTASVDDQFDDSWKEHVEKEVKVYSKMSSLQKDKVLDRRISYAEIKKCSKSLKNNKTGGNDGLVGELFKYGGKGMANLLKVLYEVVWTEESVPRLWRQGLVVSLYKKGDAEDPGNYRGITLLNVVGKMFCKILNDRLVVRLESERALHEGQAGFREKRSCVDNIFSLTEIIQGRMREGQSTYAFCLDISKSVRHSLA